jgi:hypothetical protein
MVLSANLKVLALLLLQELRLYAVSFLVCILLGLLRSGRQKNGATWFVSIVFAVLSLDTIRSILRRYLQRLLLGTSRTRLGHFRSGRSFCRMLEEKNITLVRSRMSVLSFR